jgi:hypothetical protein
MVYSLNLTFIANRNNSTGIDLAPGETIYFGSLEFTADCFGRMSLSPEGDDPGAIFIGMMHNMLPRIPNHLLCYLLCFTTSVSH